MAVKRLGSAQTDIYDSPDSMVKFFQEKGLAPQTVHHELGGSSERLTLTGCRGRLDRV